MRRKYWAREKFKWWNAKVTQTQKEHPVKRKMIKWKTKCYSIGGFFLYLQNHTFKTEPHERISFNCVEVYIILNVSRRKNRYIKYLGQLHSCNLPTFNFLAMMWSLAEAVFGYCSERWVQSYRNKWHLIFFSVSVLKSEIADMHSFVSEHILSEFHCVKVLIDSFIVLACSVWPSYRTSPFTIGWDFIFLPSQSPSYSQLTSISPLWVTGKIVSLIFLFLNEGVGKVSLFGLCPSSFHQACLLGQI